MIHSEQTMPWARLASPFAQERPGSPALSPPLTLVTLTVCDGVTRDEIEFYGDAEMTAIKRWAHHGSFILALTAVGRGELTLLCPANARSTLSAVKQLPMVSAGIADYDIRGVQPIIVRAMSVSDERS